MRSIRLFFTFGVALLIFLGAFMSEKARLLLWSQVEDPYQSARVLRGKVGVTQTQETKDVFTPVGEVFRLFPGGLVDFSETTRDVLDGTVFWSTKLFYDESVEQRFAAAFSTGIFVAEELALGPGLLKVGPLVIKSNGANVLIYRDLDSKQTRLWVEGSSVELAFSGAKAPLVVPSFQSVVLGDSVFADEGLWEKPAFEQKTVLTLQSFRLHTGDIEASNELKRVVQLQSSIDLVEYHRRALDDFIMWAPKTWTSHRLANTWGRIIHGVKSVQQYTAPPMVREKKQALEFQASIAPYIEAYYLALEGSDEAAKDFLKEAGMLFSRPQWEDMQDKNKTVQEKFLPYVRAHQSLFRVMPDHHQQKLISDFWFDRFVSGKLAWLRRDFQKAGLYLLKGSVTRAEEGFGAILEKFSDLDVDERDRFFVAQLRRELATMLELQEELFVASAYRFYQALVEKELLFEKDSASWDQFRAGRLREVGVFLDHFFGKTVDRELSQLVFELYDRLDIAQVSKNLAQEVLSPEAKERIRVMRKLGSTNLSEETLAQIRADESYQEELDQEISELQSLQDEEAETKAPGHIQNAKDLQVFLEEHGLWADKMKIQTFPEQKLTEFSDARYFGKRVSGMFDYTTQFFLVLIVGQKTNEQFHARFLEAVLSSSVQQNETEVVLLEEEEPSGTDDGNFVAQNAPKVVLQREFVREVFESEGFVVFRSDIEALDQELNRFQVNNAQIGQELSFDFVYNKADESVSQIRLKRGKSSIELGTKSFPRAGVVQALTQETEKIFAQEKKN